MVGFRSFGVPLRDPLLDTYLPFGGIIFNSVHKRCGKLELAGMYRHMWEDSNKMALVGAEDLSGAVKLAWSET